MAATAHLIDLTRLVSRQGHRTLTGIDRVELAWLSHLLTLETPLYALVRTPAGCLLLPRAGAQAVQDMALGRLVPDRLDLLSRLTRRGNPARGRAETLLRRMAIARLPIWALARGALPQGALYLNFGHSNLSAPVLAALGKAGLRRVVMVHDCIPLDHPEYSRADAPAAFAAKLAAVSAHADAVIHLTHATRAGTEVHLSRLGRVPPGIVAPLGVTVAPPDPSALPSGLDLTPPYFVILGTIEPRKNHALLLDVWDHLAKTSAPLPRLFIAGGRGWAGPDLLARLDRHPPGVIELPGLSDGAVSALLSGARALLFPSHAEGFGLPAIEAVALSVPLICSDLPVFHEILNDYPVYLRPDDIYSWSETIKEVSGADRFAATGSVHVLPQWQEHFRAVLTSV
ncbi:MAG: glycosyl transferase [Rhodobacteraceae bacterium PARR1]|nr:MAG: glycosyl transferase [Rhodobacteraceae bacterium PARR1]